MGFLAIAVFKVKKGKEEECLSVCRRFYGYLRQKGYSRDVIYRDSAEPDIYFDIRMWTSKEAANSAHQDPEVHNFWARLGKVSRWRQSTTSNG